MSENFNTALVLMGIGMVTVFIILSLVVLVGNTIISFVNRYLPATLRSSTKSMSPANTTLSENKIAAIVAAVQVVTNGKGRVVKIEKN